ncbi:phenoloxidase-activating factor 2-like [Anopheles cruzii]|uniref:phenoloxidase-activating factor 2-like n=1 Tax=Anopheles cruzii TaxID=68878 RepID=UPI0022EC6F3D|nr:phenoloxidase-activating factor 2-like [Anopheles cruzii]
MNLLVAGFIPLVLLVTLAGGVHGQSTCSGKCVPLKNCLQDEDDAPPEVDLRIGQEESTVVGQCAHYLDVCCSDDHISEEQSSATNGPRTTTEEQFQPCGQRNTDGVGFRIGGVVDEAEYGEFPWTLLVMETTDIGDFGRKEIYVCVASLLAPNVALTVAHNVVNKTARNLLVRAGEWDTRTDSEVLPTQESGVQNVLVHERYNHHHHFDVALLVLAKPFYPAENVQTICLPPPGVRPAATTECITGGWGKDKFGKGGVYQQILKRVTLPIVQSGKCQEALRTTRLGVKYNLHSSFLCAGGKEGADVCSGDGGAALVCPMHGSSTRYYQAGIVAWGIGCGDKVPGVYVDVPSVRDWIVNNLQSLSVNRMFYEGS